MNGLMSFGAIAGLGIGTGFWLILVRVPWSRKASFGDRIESQLRSVSNRSRLLVSEDTGKKLFVPFERLVGLLISDASGWMVRFNPANAALRLRLMRAGVSSGVLNFRAQQILWCFGGVILACGAVVTTALRGAFHPVLAVTLIFIGAGLGFLARTGLLNRRIMRREARMLAEFPALAELMALAVSAGESVTGALERVSDNSAGPLPEEFGVILASTRSGVSLTDALRDFSRRNRIVPLTRFTDGLAIAVERGTPIVEILRAQAQDVRELAKRQLIESAGKREIAMMIPLVFGILPLTVIFVAFPGLQLLSFSF